MASTRIGDFFNRRFFEIPKYQRGFAWEKQNIRELFDDVKEAIESNSNHYIGTIVLSKDSVDDEKFYVVDGQQRITTITLMMSALVRKLTKKDSDYYERFYVREDERFRLTPMSRDRKYFIDLLKGEVGEPQNKSQRFLKEAFEEIEFKVAAIPDSQKFLKSIEKLEVLEFVENSEGDAIRIFQTVNDRGKPLSNMEKAKSLLIYFSNRYLGKKLDNTINEVFSDIFEVYDDLKHMGEDLNITLIRNKDFNEDNIMRYHFVTFSNLDYDPTAAYVLQFLKNSLVTLRNEAKNENYRPIEDFINNYIDSLKVFFTSCKEVIEKAQTDEKYYKLFVMLNLSATIYPLIVKLQSLKYLDQNLPSADKNKFTFLDLVELIDVRVYKTRGTDPKADIAGFVHSIDHRTKEEIEDWMRWFNARWMSEEQFHASLDGNIYGNRALSHIFICYCEHLQNKTFTIDELKKIVSKQPSVEHILSQTPKFSPRALGFRNAEDFLTFEDSLGNLTLLEKSLNSSVQNKSALDKVDSYGKSSFKITKKVGSEIDTNKGFTKVELKARTEELAKFCNEIWWC
jgi:hypothetical protein